MEKSGWKVYPVQAVFLNLPSQTGIHKFSMSRLFVLFIFISTGLYSCDTNFFSRRDPVTGSQTGRDLQKYRHPELIRADSLLRIAKNGPNRKKLTQAYLQHAETMLIHSNPEIALRDLQSASKIAKETRL